MNTQYNITIHTVILSWSNHEDVFQLTVESTEYTHSFPEVGERRPESTECTHSFPEVGKDGQL